MSISPIILEVPDGGKAAGTLEFAVSAPSDRHTLHLRVRRGWVDLLIGTSDGGGELTKAEFSAERLRLQPGVHLVSFTPGAAAIFVTVERNGEGYAALDQMRFVDAGDLELATPYREGEMRSLRSEQQRSVRWFWHYAHPWSALVRYANDSWGFIEWVVNDGPFVPGDYNITMTASARRGVDRTMTASMDWFDPLHVGALLELTHAGQYVEVTATGADEWSEPIRVTGVEDGRKFTVSVSSLGSNTMMLQRSVGTDYDWTDVQSYAAGTSVVDDGFDNSVIYYRIGVPSGGYVSGSPFASLTFAAGETTGAVRLTEYISPTQMYADVVTPLAATTATRAWQEGAWSPLRGYPAAGGLFDGRIWLGGVLNLWGSSTRSLDSFYVGDDDADAISRTLTIGDASPIRWVKGSMRLQIGTDADVADIEPVLVGDPGTLQVRSTALDEPITPTNMNARPQSTKVVFVDTTTYKLRRVGFDVETQSFVTEDLNRLHEEIGLLGGGFIDLAATTTPNTRLWTPRADGQLAVLSLVEADAVVGWSRYTFDGYAVSVTGTAGVRSGEASDDFAYIVTRRELDGVTRRMHERVENDRWVTSERAWHLERAAFYEGEPASVLVGLDHLLGLEVLVWGRPAGLSGGAQYGPFTVGVVNDAGEIGVDLGDDLVDMAIIGQEMRSRYMSGKLPYGAQAGSAVGELKKVSHVLMLFHKTALGSVRVGIGDAADAAGDTGDTAAVFENATMHRPLDLVQDFDTDAATVLFSGELLMAMPETHHLRDPRVLIEFDGAGPAAVLGYVVDMQTNEG